MQHPTKKHESNGWHKGPMPPETWGWGAVVIKDMPLDGGFYFADFRGDKVITVAETESREIPAADVLLYNNSITLAPTS